MTLFRRLFSLVLLGVAACNGPSGAPTSAPATAAGKKPKGPPPLARLFVQDLASASLRWADVRAAKDGTLSLDAPAAVEGVKAFDPAKQKLVQMRHADGVICVGVRDDEEGAFESGWLLIRSGVRYLDHGDHGHWNFRLKPAQIDARLGQEQGNPAHLYEYGGKFFVANDKLNGCTRLDPTGYAGDARPEPTFVAAGGGHITLAAADDKVVYGTWIDGGGPNMGRIDVAAIGPGSRSETAYSLKLPHGGLHGAAVAAGKVFFAPSDGVCWVDTDPELKRKPAEVAIHHISLGKDGEKPRRTGAFTVHDGRVLFTTGRLSPELAILDARHADPKPLFVKLPPRPGTTATPPEVAEVAGGKRLAFTFRDAADKKKPAEEALEVIDLDPNGDGDYADARHVKSVPVGKSAVDGHNGHHAIASEAGGGWAFFTNPGDGTVSALSLKTLEVAATFPIGGTPGAIIVCGGRETDD